MPPPVKRPNQAPAVEPEANGKKPKAKPKAVRPKKEQAPGRPVVYPELEVRAYTRDNPNGPLTAALMKELLGWEEETDAVKFGQDFLLVDEHGRKVRCHHNVGNRPFDDGHCRKLAQDVLRRNWADSVNSRPDDPEPMSVNGETMVFTWTGRVDSGQHRGVALILAAQMWERSKPGSEWRQFWDSEPTMEGLVVFGVSENPRVTRTLDNVKPRSLADVLYTMGILQGTAARPITARDRAELCRMVDYAVRLLWHRTGAGLDAFAPRRTHSEAIEFIERHSRIVRAVRHLYEEDQPQVIGEGKDKRTIRPISQYLSPGYAAGLLYLMGASATEPDAYHQADVREEKAMDLSRWERAEEFWVLLAQDTPAFHEVRMALGKLNDSETGEGGSRAEKMAVLVRAWNAYGSGKNVIEEEDVSLDDITQRDPNDGSRWLTSCPDVGGIDLGDPKDQDAGPTETPATEDEVEDAKVAATEARTKPDALRKESKQLDELEACRKKHPDTVLLFKSAGTFSAWDTDAQRVGKELGKRPGLQEIDGVKVPRVGVLFKEYLDLIPKLHKADYKVAMVERVEGEWKVTPLTAKNYKQHDPAK